MEYLLTFLEGIITFISPCLLPMLPVYITYFAGEKSENISVTLKNAFAFVLGFTVVFVSLGAFASTFGKVLIEYSTWVNIIGGVIIIIFGINMLGIFKGGFLNRSKKMDFKAKNLNFLSSFLFGIVFSVGWTPCVGAFLGSALVLAAQSGEVLKGVFMLLSFSLGLGIPFVFSAVLIDKLKEAFDFIKKHYRIINIVSGSFLILVGIIMAAGFMNYLLLLFAV